MMLADNIIETAQTDWVSLIVFAPKKNSYLRNCADYYKLNTVTKRDSHPIPRVKECIDLFEESTIFPTQDANNGYWQIKIEESKLGKTLFTSYRGLYHFIRMLSASRNAPETFWRTIDVTLPNVKWMFALVYRDDIVLFSRTPEVHIGCIKHTLILQHRAGTTQKLKNSMFITDTSDNLGHVVRSQRQKIAPNITDAMSGLKPPVSLIDLRWFSRFGNVFCCFLLTLRDF